MNRYIIKNIPIHHKITIKQWVNSSFIIENVNMFSNIRKSNSCQHVFDEEESFFRENASPLVGLEIHKIEANNEDCSSEARWTNNGWNEIKRENSSWGGRRRGEWSVKLSLSDLREWSPVNENSKLSSTGCSSLHVPSSSLPLSFPKWEFDSGQRSPRFQRLPFVREPDDCEKDV